VVDLAGGWLTIFRHAGVRSPTSGRSARWQPWSIVAGNAWGFTASSDVRRAPAGLSCKNGSPTATPARAC